MIFSDMNILYDALSTSMKGSAWKREPQKFNHYWLLELCDLKKELENKTYVTSKGSEFILNERGKPRHIHGNVMRDRVVRHALCDNILGPCLQPYLIHNNGASQKGKGLSFTRNMFEKDLHNYYLKHGDNKGFIGFVDLSRFFDNIRHDKIKETLYPKIPKEYWWVMDEILHNMEIDVSYLTDEEYKDCMEIKFNSVDYYEKISAEQTTGEKFLAKSVNIGDQVSQDIGVFYPHRLDNYIKIVRGIKYYGRYMDDIYFMVETKEEALSLIEDIKKQIEALGLFMNEKKTHIVKMSDTYKFLQIKYSLTDTGKVIKRINPQSVTRERRRLKAYKRLLDKNILEYSSIELAYKSWMAEYTKIMSKKQIKNIKSLYKELFRKEPRWK